VNSASPWLSVAVALVGLVGGLGGAILGYQSGVKSVDKDYVQIAMTNLNNEKASPELRQWSVQILNKLSPVPMGGKLRNELASYIYVQPAKIPLPKFAETPCPNLIKTIPPGNKSVDQHNEVDRKFINEYEACRIKFDSIVNYLKKINEIRVDEPAKVADEVTELP